MTLVACLRNGDNMKLLAVGDLVVGEFNSVKPYLKKESEFCQPYSNHTSGLIKYLNLPEGTRIRVTIEVLEDGDCSQ